MKIKVKYHNPRCKFNFIDKGEWIDLRASETRVFQSPTMCELDGRIIFDYQLIPLGFAMELPKDFEALVLPRSGTFKNFCITMVNSQGVIDSSFAGNNDEWKFPALAFKARTINEGERICQFRIQPSQKASIWTKIKWLFTNKIEFVEVEDLQNANRGGIGSTGVK